MGSIRRERAANTCERKLHKFRHPEICKHSYPCPNHAYVVQHTLNHFHMSAYNVAALACGDVLSSAKTQGSPENLVWKCKNSIRVAAVSPTIFDHVWPWRTVTQHYSSPSFIKKASRCYGQSMSKWHRSSSHLSIRMHHGHAKELYHREQKPWIQDMPQSLSRT